MKPTRNNFSGKSARHWRRASAAIVIFALMALLFAQINSHNNHIGFSGPETLANTTSGVRHALPQHHLHSAVHVEMQLDSQPHAQAGIEAHHVAHQFHQCTRHGHMSGQQKQTCDDGLPFVPMTLCDCAAGCNGACPSGSFLPMSEGVRIARVDAGADWPSPPKGVSGLDLAPPFPPPKPFSI